MAKPEMKEKSELHGVYGGRRLGACNAGRAIKCTNPRTPAHRSRPHGERSLCGERLRKRLNTGGCTCGARGVRSRVT